MAAPLDITLQTARRLALRKQLLDAHSAARMRPADKKAILRVFQALRCIQIDPIRAVERTELLVLWSRIGPFAPDALREIVFRDRRLFEDWAHCASIVLLEDYPLFLHRKQAFARNPQAHSARMQEWIGQNGPLLEHVRTELARRGPLATGDFDADGIPQVPWTSSGWTSGRSIPRILDYLFARGEVMVADRAGNRKCWHLTSACLPPGADTRTLEDAEVSRIGLQHSLRALGVATETHIRNHFMRRSYPQWRTILRGLQTEGTLVPVRIQTDADTWLPGNWYVHAEDMSLLSELASAPDAEHTVLLSPFDNLICDRIRTRQLFDFDYTIEIYVPVKKRRYGYYVLPILANDRFLGRMDAHMDRKAETLQVRALYLESACRDNLERAEGLAHTLHSLAEFLGARRIGLGRRIPVAWRRTLRTWI